MSKAIVVTGTASGVGKTTVSGVLPATVHMRPRRLSLGYTTVTTMAPSALGPAGVTARGHEFHYSTLDPVLSSVPRVYRSCRHTGWVSARRGTRSAARWWSYAHLRLNRERQMTVILVAHDLNLAAEISDRLLLLACGEVARLGPPEQVLDEECCARCTVAT